MFICCRLGFGVLLVAMPAGLVSLPAQPVAGGPFQVSRGQMTFDAEGQEAPGTVLHSRRLHWPGGASGVTIGRGYDMKERTADEVFTDLRATEMDEKAALAYARGAKLEGAAAEKFVREHRETLPQITPEQQKALFERIYPQYEARVRAVCERPDLVKEFGKVDWDQLNPAIREVLVDLAFRGDYKIEFVRTPKLVQRAVVENNLAALLQSLSDRESWSSVPCDRFYRRVKYLREAVMRANATPGTTTGVRIIYDDTAPKGKLYASPATERIGTTATKTAGEPGFRPVEGTFRSAEFVREMGRRLREGGLPELDGNSAEQYALLKSSLQVETLWLAERTPRDEQQKLIEVQELLKQARLIRDELPLVRRKGDRTAETALNTKLREIASQVRGRTLCLRLALEEAQYRADRGDLVVAVWKGERTAGSAWIVPTRGADARLKEATDWPGLSLPHAAYAGTTVTGYAPLGDGFGSVESITGLGLFVLRPAPQGPPPNPRNAPCGGCGA